MCAGRPAAMRRAGGGPYYAQRAGPGRGGGPAQARWQRGAGGEEARRGFCADSAERIIGWDANGGVESEAGGRQASTITGPWLAHGTDGCSGRRGRGQHGTARCVMAPPCLWLRCSPECPALDGNQTGPKLRMVMGVTLDMRRLRALSRRAGCGQLILAAACAQRKPRARDCAGGKFGG